MDGWDGLCFYLYELEGSSDVNYLPKARVGWFFFPPFLMLDSVSVFFRFVLD